MQSFSPRQKSIVLVVIREVWSLNFSQIQGNTWCLSLGYDSTFAININCTEMHAKEKLLSLWAYLSLRVLNYAPCIVKWEPLKCHMFSILSRALNITTLETIYLLASQNKHVGGKGVTK